MSEYMSHVFVYSYTETPEQPQTETQPYSMGSGFAIRVAPKKDHRFPYETRYAEVNTWGDFKRDKSALPVVARVLDVFNNKQFQDDLIHAIMEWCVKYNLQGKEGMIFRQIAADVKKIAGDLPVRFYDQPKIGISATAISAPAYQAA